MFEVCKKCSLSNTQLICSTFSFYFIFFSQNALYLGFTISANIVETSRGSKRIYYDGHSYGIKCANRKIKHLLTWRCTRASGSDKRRCYATVQTTIIEGITMMRLHNTDHICGAASRD